LTWHADISVGTGLFDFAVQVTDDGVPNLSDSREFESW
jgi:hypothetical protein